MKRRVVLLGPPGAGKGTQARVLALRLGVPHVSTGDLFRWHVSQETPLGRKAREYLERGLLVPDEITVSMVAEKMDGRGFVLDGFPRNLAQARALEEILRRRGEELDAALLLEVPEEELVERLSGRRVCAVCGRNYHLRFQPPPGGRCSCGGELLEREDDREEVVRRRIRVYREETSPLVEFYEGRGKLIRVDGLGDPDEVSSRILAALSLDPV